VIDLSNLADLLAVVEDEAQGYGLSKSLRDRIKSARQVLPVIEAARERTYGMRAR
jgi:hypothetical protein